MSAEMTSGSRFWPVERHEHKKVIPMIGMMFLICFNYTLLRDLKDILVLEGMATSAITWLKLGFVLPFSILVMLSYTKMTHFMSKPAIFYTWMGIFIGFFALFGAVLYPLKHYLEPGDKWIAKFIKPTLKDIAAAEKSGKAPLGSNNGSFPQSLVPVIMIIGRWCTSLLYVMSELWGTVVLSLLFWGFANDICRTSEAKRFYTLFTIGANCSLLLCGTILIAIGFAARSTEAVATSSKFDMMYVLMFLVVVIGFIIVGIYRWIQNNVLTDSRLYTPAPPKAKKKKPSMRESLRVIFQSSYIALIALMVILYGLSVNLIEIYYKEQWKTKFPQRWEKYVFQGGFSLGTGFIALILLVFVGGETVRKRGWTFTALVTPTIMLITGLPFLVLVCTSLFTSIPIQLELLVALGWISVVLSKSCKYAFFDPVKEMTYIPLGEDRGRAKAAVDVVGARFGKSGGSLIQVVLLHIFNTKEVADIIIAIVPMMCIAVVAWIIISVMLGRMYDTRIKVIEEQTKEAGQMVGVDVTATTTKKSASSVNTKC